MRDNRKSPSSGVALLIIAALLLFIVLELIGFIDVITSDTVQKWIEYILDS